MYGKKKPPVFYSNASLYPLNSAPEKNSAAKQVTELIGGGKTGGNGATLSDEANVNIDEVARSRKTREAVCGEKLKEFGNKTIGELIILEYNKHKSFFADSIEISKNSEKLIDASADIFENTYTAKFSKTNLLEINYSNSNQELLSPIIYTLISKITQFYKELKIKKAKIDYDFMQKKYDSLSNVLASLDQKQISLNERTLFVRTKLKYMIPQQNIENERLQILVQKNSAAANVEEAHWRLEKTTPIIELLDKPEPPFKKTKTSAILYGTIGFIFGLLLATLLFTINLLFRFSVHQVNNTIESKLVEPVPETKTTTS